jgi:hypothetical protein
MTGLSVLFKHGVQVEGCFDEFMHTCLLGVLSKITSWTLQSCAITDDCKKTANTLTNVFPFTRKQGNLRNLGTDLQVGANNKLTAVVPWLFVFSNSFTDEPCGCERMKHHRFWFSTQVVIVSFSNH